MNIPREICRHCGLFSRDDRQHLLNGFRAACHVVVVDEDFGSFSDRRDAGLDVVRLVLGPVSEPQVQPRAAAQCDWPVHRGQRRVAALEVKHAAVADCQRAGLRRSVCGFCHDVPRRDAAVHPQGHTRGHRDHFTLALDRHTSRDGQILFDRNVPVQLEGFIAAVNGRLQLFEEACCLSAFAALSVVISRQDQFVCAVSRPCICVIRIVYAAAVAGKDITTINIPAGIALQEEQIRRANGIAVAVRDVDEIVPPVIHGDNVPHMSSRPGTAGHISGDADAGNISLKCCKIAEVLKCF